MPGLGSTLFVAAVLLVCVVLAVRSIVRSRRRGSGGCTGNCADCASRCRDKEE